MKLCLDFVFFIHNCDKRHEEEYFVIDQELRLQFRVLS